MYESLQHAEVHLSQASMAGGRERAALLAAAKDALIRAETVEKGCGSWRLACISALEGNHELCRRWLERASAYGSLPSKSAVESEPHLENMRGQKWFKQFLREMEE